MREVARRGIFKFNKGGKGGVGTGREKTTHIAKNNNNGEKVGLAVGRNPMQNAEIDWVRVAGGGKKYPD